jgi:hypothetical protein
MGKDNELPLNLCKPQRALANAGITTLKISVKEISGLHGVGPNAIKKISHVLDESKLSFIKSKLI